MNPAVSVIIPCYKVADYIAETLDSVRSQTFRNFETIVVNDGSPDTEHFERVLEPYRGEIQYIRQDNGGPSAARNAAIRVARAPLIALLDGDDVWEPRYLESQIALFEANPDADVVYPNARCFGDVSFEYFHNYRRGDKITFISLVTQRSHVFGCATVKREALMRVGLYDASIRAAEDLELWLRLVRTGSKFVFNPQLIYHYRSRSGSLTNDLLSLLHCKVQICLKHLDNRDLTNEERMVLENEMSKSQARAELILAKRALYACRRAEALERFANANEVLDSGRVHIALLLLRVCPKLLYAYIHRRYTTEYSYLH